MSNLFRILCVQGQMSTHYRQVFLYEPHLGRQVVMGMPIRFMYFLMLGQMSMHHQKNSGPRSIHTAAESGHTDIIQILLDAGANVNAPPAKPPELTALQTSAANDNIRIIMILVRAGADVNGKASLRDGRTALEIAAEHGRLDTVQLLLDAEEDLWGDNHRQYQNALRLADENGHHVVSKIIRERYLNSIVHWQD
ncbi:ankyrin repeat-containing domain protein [Xylaria nigripes]|nr:ankyrin repeat-containing domain protein [Xylaria nigripes]